MIRAFYVDELGKLQTDLTRPDIEGVLASGAGTLWVDLEISGGPADAKTIEVLSGIFKFHPLAIEDCVHTLQYSRVDTYHDYIFVIAHGPQTDAVGRVQPVELDFFLGNNYVVTFRTEPMPLIEAVADDVVKNPGQLGLGADWLAHNILDNLVDAYLPVIDGLTAQLERLESQAFGKPEPALLAEILAAKRDVTTVHRIAAPLREVISRLSREELSQIRPAARLYYRDVHDHLVRVSERSNELREVADSALTIFAMSQSNRATDVIKGLTVLATFSIPPVVVFSIYGMNFDYMPELHWRFGYPFAILLTLTISLSLLGLLKWKKWL